MHVFAEMFCTSFEGKTKQINVRKTKKKLRMCAKGGFCKRKVDFYANRT